MTFNSKQLIGTIFVVLGLACTSHKPLPINTMKQLVWEMGLYTDNGFVTSADSILYKNSPAYQAILDKHHITTEQYQLSVDYYMQHIAEFKILLDSIGKYGVRESAKYNNILPEPKSTFNNLAPNKK